MHGIQGKIRCIRCPLPSCDGYAAPDETNIDNWKCKVCGRVWFVKLVGSK